ncbi:transposase [Methanothrix sp.]|uniref:transposase n=1 Tax=Methanothrix sp. TaxID=90426 RepID=UPI003C71EF50
MQSYCAVSLCNLTVVRLYGPTGFACKLVSANFFAVDSTGFRTTQFNVYSGAKYGQKKEHQWVKAHLCAGVKTNIVAAVTITYSNGGDSPQFGPLLKKTSEGFTINEVSVDMAYSSRPNLQLVANEGGKAYIPFRKNATGKARGSALWSKMYPTSNSIVMSAWSTTIRGAISRLPMQP